MLTKTLKVLAIAGVLAGATTAATAWPPTWIDHELNRAVVSGQRGGFDRVMFNRRDQMETGGREVQFVVLLQAGADYRLAARCGTDCVNLNLSIRDAAGRELAADRTGGGVPGFDFRAPHSGAYVVTLDLASCRTPRCNVGAVVLGRGTSPDA